MVRRVRAWGLWLLVAGVANTAAMGQDVGERVSRHGRIHEDYYAAGGSVVLQGSVEGDAVVAGGLIDLDADVSGIVLAAGGDVRLRSQVQGDVMALGGSVDLRGTLADDARLAGGEVTVHARVAGDLVAAGGRVVLAPGGHVEGRAALAGSTVEINGVVEHRLLVAGGTVAINGVVNGDVDAEVGQLILGPAARIAGALTYRSPDRARIDLQAQVGGKIQHVVSPLGKRWGQALVAARLVTATLIAVALFVTGAAWLGLFPAFSRAASATLHQYPGQSLLVGIALALGVPLVGVGLSATGLGVPLALFLSLSYLPAMLLGLVTTAFSAADMALQLAGRDDSTSTRLLALLGAALLLAGVYLIPFVGVAALVLGTAMGLGAFWLRLGRADAGR